MKIKCQRCGNEWEYTGDKLNRKDNYPKFVQCTKCLTSVKLNKKIKEK